MSGRSSRQPARGRPRRRSGDDGSSDSEDSDHDTSTYDGNQTQQNDTEPETRPRRTRTLMTPQQLTILYALLEQTRFPTSAQREEAARQTGLTARKVQVWFQNQRQKQSDAAKRAPPTYPGGPPEAYSSRQPMYASAAPSRIQEPRRNYPQYTAPTALPPGGGRPSVFESRSRGSGPQIPVDPRHRSSPDQHSSAGRAAQNATLAWQQQQHQHHQQQQAVPAYGQRSVPQPGAPGFHGMTPPGGHASAESYRQHPRYPSASPPRADSPSYTYGIAHGGLRLPPLRPELVNRAGPPTSPTASSGSYRSPISPIGPPFTLEPDPIWDPSRIMRQGPGVQPSNPMPDRQRSRGNTFGETRLPLAGGPPPPSQYSQQPRYAQAVPRGPPMEMRPSPQAPSASSPRGPQMPAAAGPSGAPVASGSGAGPSRHTSASPPKRWGWSRMTRR